MHIDSELLPVSDVGEVDVVLFVDIEVHDELKDKASARAYRAAIARAQIDIEILIEFKYRVC